MVQDFDKFSKVNDWWHRDIHCALLTATDFCPAGDGTSRQLGQYTRHACLHHGQKSVVEQLMVTSPLGVNTSGVTQALL